MAPDQEHEPSYTAGQLAQMLGCSLRSIYRWEETGVIPLARRVERGGVSTRIYTDSEAEEIRRALKGRLDYGASLRRAVARLFPRAPRVVYVQRPAKRHTKRRAKPRVVKVKSGNVRKMTRKPALPDECAPLFIQAMEFAQEHGCEAVTVTTPDGRSQTFAWAGQEAAMATR